MPQPKDIDWLNGYKNKTHIYAALQETYFRTRHAQIESEEMENIFHKNGNEKEAGWQYSYQTKWTIKQRL